MVVAKFRVSKEPLNNCKFVLLPRGGIYIFQYVTLVTFSKNSIFQRFPNLLISLALSFRAYAFDASIEETKELGWCEGVFIYAAQYSQLHERPNAAVNLLARAATTMAANFFLNRNSNGEVDGKRVHLSKSTRKNVKPLLDQNPTEIESHVNRCNEIVQPLSVRAMTAKGLLFEKTFPEFQKFMLESMKSSLGLN